MDFIWLLAIADDYVSSTFRILVIEEVVKYILARSEINTQKKFVSQSQYKNTLNKKKTTKNNREWKKKRIIIRNDCK
jgi:ribosomal protein L35